jgi:hypothetical protein
MTYKCITEKTQVSHTLTQAGALIGTPEYMAPEQVQGEPADVRMDIYALGCIMYQLLTGQLPFSDKTMFGVLSQQVNVRPVPPRQLAPDADIPPEVEAIILKAMEKERPNRFQSMAELIEAIVAAPRGSSDRMGTTSNLDAAASAARIAAAMNAASANQMAVVGPATPQDISFPGGSGSAGAVPVTHGSAVWPGVARDPKLLTKLVIGLGAAVFMLLIGLVCALNRGDDSGPSFLAPWLARAGAATAIPGPSSVALNPATPDKLPTEVPPKPDTPPDVVKPTPDIILEDDPAKKTPPKDPVKKRDPAKKTPPKDPVPLAEPTLERLEPFDLKKTLNAFSKDIEGCRAANNATRGSIAVIKMKVEGATGRVLDAVPEDPTPAAKCIAKVVKAKVKFPRFKLKVQEFKQRFQM